jgi:threonyl-tRNA synthetase
MGSVQLDYQLPERLDLRYIAADGRDRAADGSPNRPVMIHRALLGPLERFIGVLLESDDGWLPAWCSPRQVAVLPVSAHQAPAAERAAAQPGCAADLNVSWR